MENQENLGTYDAVLIDIDRSLEKTKDASHLHLHYSRAEMYKCGDTAWWTCENLDWKQLGLLIRNILDQDDDHFVEKLINLGKLI